LQHKNIFIKYFVTIQAYERKSANETGYALLAEAHVQKYILKNVPML